MKFINDAIENDAVKIIKAKSEGEAVIDILAKIYADRLPDKTLAQGKIMGSAVIQEIKNFDADYKAAQTDQDKFINDSLAKMNAGNTCVERCNFWLRITEVISSAAQANDVNQENRREEILDNIQKLSVNADEATPEREQELMNKAADAIKNSPIMLAAFTKHAEELAALQNKNLDETANLLINIGADEAEYRAVISMLVYTACKNGEIDDAPADLTAQQVAVAVCTEFEQIKIAEAVQNGSLAVDVASTLLFILGTVALVRFIIAAALVTSIAAANSFGLLIAVPAILMINFGAIRLFTKALEAWAEDSERIVNGVFVGVSFIISGLKAVGEFIFKNITSVFHHEKAENTEQVRNLSFA